MADYDLKGRVALVTGGGEGIGRASALALAKAGAKVGVLGRTMENIQKTADEIQDAGGEALPVLADITEADKMQAAMDELVEAYGRLDIVFANAGINGLWAPIEEMSPEDFAKTININVNGTFHTLKFAYPYMKENGGSMIVTASINGTRVFSNTGATAYSASKAAQAAMVKMLALEFASERIRVNVICPGAIESSIDDNTSHGSHDAGEPVEYPEGQVPLTDGKSGSAEDVAKLVLYLSSDDSRHVTGTEIFIDGAQSLLIG
ncbi:SDR family oxidoreductase [Cerasicoccus fimbriatus]|uniref:SDR family oxidoreductase n=1 Tax=Cerasicoccus fimbriatus TaxID=3014554 RepID=UPI0022B313B0|nr:SDR family NAD(P)-dependent oxidoreductase [Cerasicoccus sp. TK19100]